MSFKEEIKGFITKVKEYKILIVSFLSLFGLTGGGLTTWVMDSMDKTAANKIEQHTLPVVKREIYFVLDSMMKAKKTSFRQEVGDKMGFEKDDVADSLTYWWRSELGRYNVGLFFEPIDGRIMYIHTNGRKYRAFFDDDQDGYYFINDDDESEWCK